METEKTTLQISKETAKKLNRLKALRMLSSDDKVTNDLILSELIEKELEKQKK